MDEKQQPEVWYFTFGIGHPYTSRYVEIVGSFAAARATMHRAHGDRWCGQYRREDKARAIDQYGMTSLATLVADRIEEGPGGSDDESEVPGGQQ